MVSSYRRAFSRAAVACVSALAAAPIGLTAQSFSVREATIADVHAAIRERRVTCRALVQQYLDRIAANDKQGPAINALITINDRALTTADSLDRAMTRGGALGALHCIPVIVKDNFETRDLPTSNGALALARWVPTRDATQVARVRAAGAIVLAKANLAEWAFTPYETVGSALPGYTRNPYALNRVTAGSSGGTAAAVAASFGTVGLGSDTGNSIRGPSAHQALVGIRSTMGLTSRAGVIPLNAVADIAGPMTRTVRDAVEVLQVIAGPDAADTVTRHSASRRDADYRAALVPDGLRGARIGILRQAFAQPTADTEVLAVFGQAVQDMRRAGATVIDSANVPGLQEILRSARGACNRFAFDLATYFATRGEGAPVRSVREVLANGGYHPTVQARLQAAVNDTVAPESQPGCAAREAMRERLRAAVTRLMDSLQLDALIYPTWSNPPRLIGDLNTPHGDNSQQFSPLTGFPAITVPMGYTRGNTLPAGLTLFGRAWSESRLITLAFGYEQVTRHRKSPPLVP
jgi:Asp-tRNA(Asn)/Glu-tRNA(Gln) amidotransferase A subunit family amidase